MDGADNPSWPLLTRHFSGVTSPEEEATLQQWIDAEPSRAEFVQALRAAWDVTGQLPERHSAVAGWQRVQRRLARETSTPASLRATSETPLRRPSQVSPRVPHGRTPRSRPVVLHGIQQQRWGTRAIIRAAAAIVIAAGLPAAAFWGPLTHFAADFVRTQRAPVAVALHEASTDRGQRATLRLADGTQITLGPASTLRYPDAFSQKTGDRRDVYLDGEAYFEVTHNAAHPFIVHARGTITEDLGTAFVVRAYAGDSAVQVAVSEGKVALRSAHDSMRAARGAMRTDMRNDTTRTQTAILTRGLVGSLAPGAQPTVVAGADVALYLAWTEGRLVFHDTPLRDVLPELARWYDVDVRFAPGADSLGARRFTASFADQPLTEVLTFLALSADVRVDRHRRTITLSPQRHP